MDMRVECVGSAPRRVNEGLGVRCLLAVHTACVERIGDSVELVTVVRALIREARTGWWALRCHPEHGLTMVDSTLNTKGVAARRDSHWFLQHNLPLKVEPASE